MNADGRADHPVLFRALVVAPDAVPSPGDHVAERPTHWTWDLDWAKHFATQLAEPNWDADGAWDETKERVVLVAHDVAHEDLVDDPAVIAELRHGFDIDEPEVVVAAGRSVHVASVLRLVDHARWEETPGPPTVRA